MSGRLDVLRVSTPALRNRADKECLIDSLLSKLCRQHNLPRKKIASTELDVLLQHDWPGNVRELESALLRLLIEGTLTLSPNRSPEGLSRRARQAGTRKLNQHLEAEKLRLIDEALREANFDKRRAAAMLGLSRAQLYRELAKRSTDDPL